jgi:hypothetical protein
VSSRPTIPYSEQLKEVRRELAKRETVFPRFVAEGKMSQRKADYHMEAMRAVAETLKPLAEAEQPELALSQPAPKVE